MFPDVDSGGKWQVSKDGGNSPLWSPDVKELFCVGNDEAMRVSVETEPIFRQETPKNLFNAESYSGWDIDPEGKRFLIIKEAETTGDDSSQKRLRKTNIVLNWFEELKELVPVE